MAKNKLRQTAFPLLAALIWGTSFVSQSISTDYLGPFTFNAVRSLVAAAALLLAAKLFDRRKKAQLSSRSGREKKADRKALLIGGVCCGVVLTAAANLQQMGIAETSAGKTAFITALYIVIVPVLGIFLKKKTGLNVWISVAIAVVGLYLLCIKDGLSIAVSDLYVVACSVVFAVHILIIDYFTDRVDGVWLSCVQFFTVTVVSGVCAFIFEEPDMGQIIKCAGPILYMGVFSSGVGYTLQILAQKDANPTVVTLLLSLESVFGTLSGMLILEEQMTAREYVGCGVMFAAVILAQLPAGKKIRTEKKIHEA